MDAVGLIDEKAESTAAEAAEGNGDALPAAMSSSVQESSRRPASVQPNGDARQDFPDGRARHTVRPADTAAPVPGGLPAHDTPEPPALRSGRDYNYFKDVRAALSRLRSCDDGPEEKGSHEQDGSRRQGGAEGDRARSGAP